MGMLEQLRTWDQDLRTSAQALAAERADARARNTPEKMAERVAAMPQQPAKPTPSPSYRNTSNVFSDVNAGLKALSKPVPGQQTRAGRLAYDAPPPPSATTPRVIPQRELQNFVPQNGLVGESGKNTGRTLSMTGRDPKTGMGPDSRGIVASPGDSTYALQQGRLANAIRQQTIDSQRPDQKVVRLGNTRLRDWNRDDSVEGLYDRGRRLVADATTGNQSALESFGKLGMASLYRDQAKTRSDQERDFTTVQGGLQRTQMDNEAVADYRAASAAQARAQANYYLNGGAAKAGKQFGASDFQTLMTALIDTGQMPLLEDGTPDPEVVKGFLNKVSETYGWGGQQRMAEGGVVQRYAGGGMVEAMPSPPMPDPQAVQGYQKYAAGARAMGLPLVDFDTFAQMTQGAPQIAGAQGQQPYGMAAGGQVPQTDASGKLVIDSNPNAATDSIPAVIDGQAPAALDSGEFVIPQDVVLFFGTDKFEKMIAAARKQKDGGAKPGGASVLQAAASGSI